jgi:hypothetical protein
MDLPTLADPPSARRRRFQYSLRTLFIFSIILALFSAGSFYPEYSVRAITFAVWTIFFTSFLLAMAIYGHGYFRSFCIGAIASSSLLTPIGFTYTYYSFLLVWSSANDIGNGPSEQTTNDIYFYYPAICIGISLFVSFLGGLTVVLTRWMIDSANRRNQPAAAPPTPPAAPPN